MEAIRLSYGDQQALLRIAREVIVEATGTGVPMEQLGLPPSLEVKAGAFVTLRESNGALRGCIGTFDTTRALREVVAEMAYAAALRDPRFAPLRSDEVESLKISISVLAPPEEVRALDEVEVGRHGLIASLRGRRGVLLAKVPVENGWSREEFLGMTCLKAGLRQDEWRRFGAPDAVSFSKFETFDFAE